jgi:hypothetical protein
MNLELPDLIGAILGFVLTLMVVSYVIKDNALFRLAIHIFIGVSAGYATVLVIYNVIWYQLLAPLILSPLEKFPLVIPPILLGIWLFAKASPKLSRLGSPVVAFLVGVGAATAISGAVSGTLFPQVSATINLFDLEATGLGSWTQQAKWLINSLLILIGTVTSLAYFHFGIRSRGEQTGQRPLWIEVLAQIGQVFIAIAFGALFAGAYAAALAALVERVSFIWDFFSNLLGLIL